MNTLPLFGLCNSTGLQPPSVIAVIAAFAIQPTQPTRRQL
jgi:hypothetical protein